MGTRVRAIHENTREMGKQPDLLAFTQREGCSRVRAQLESLTAARRASVA